VCVQRLEAGGEGGEVRVGVLLCRDSEASFLCVQHYTLHLISYYLALCLFSGWKLGERGGR
jgi:hypothetical protein